MDIIEHACNGSKSRVGNCNGNTGNGNDGIYNVGVDGRLFGEICGQTGG